MRVGRGDVERFAVTVEAFRQLDDRFGGGNARPALIQYLGTDADRLLRGRYTGTVGSALFSAVAEATLLAAWPSRTESANTGVASIQVTVTIGCRVAADDRPLGVAAQVDRAVADAVSERVRQWDADGLALEDQLMASYGPAMEVYGRHGRVLNPDGTNADLDRYLNIARRTVRDAMRLRVDELPLETFDATTRFAIFWLRAKGRAQVPKGEARFFAQADELRLDELRGRILSESSAGFRLRLDDPGLVGPGSSTIEVVRAMVHAWEAGGTEAVATVIAAADREPTDQHVWAVVADLARQIPSADKLAQALAGIQRMSNTVSTLVGSARESAAQMSMFGERGELL
jgi:hypothetical protein